MFSLTAVCGTGHTHQNSAIYNKKIWNAYDTGLTPAFRQTWINTDLFSALQKMPDNPNSAKQSDLCLFVPLASRQADQSDHRRKARASCVQKKYHTIFNAPALMHPAHR